MIRKLKLFLLAEAIVCAAFCILKQTFEITITSIIAFPFDQIGFGLRTLSTASSAGNIIAIVIYCALSLIPAAYFAFRTLKRRRCTEDGLLILLSLTLFVVIYHMINPVIIAEHLSLYDDNIDAGKAVYGLAVYSMIAGYFILRALRAVKDSDVGYIFRCLKILLTLVCAVLVFSIFGVGFSELMASFGELSGYDTDQYAGLSYVFLVLQAIVSLLPIFLGIIIIFLVLDFIDAFRADPYGETVVASVREIGRVGRKSVIAIMISQITVNTLQLAVGSIVYFSYYTFDVPLFAVVMLLAVMLLAEYFEQTRRLKDDNDMFI